MSDAERHRLYGFVLGHLRSGEGLEARQHLARLARDHSELATLRARVEEVGRENVALRDVNATWSGVKAAGDEQINTLKETAHALRAFVERVSTTFQAHEGMRHLNQRWDGDYPIVLGCLACDARALLHDGPDMPGLRAENERLRDNTTKARDLQQRWLDGMSATDRVFARGTIAKATLEFLNAALADAPAPGGEHGR